MSVIMPSTGGYAGPEIEDDTYVLTVKEVTILPSDGKPDNFGKIQDRLRVKFLVVGLQGEDDEAVYVDPMMNAKLSDGGDGRYPASTYYKLCVALGLDPEQITYGVDTDDLVGLQCKGTIVTGENGWPRVTQYIKLPKGAAKNGAKATAQKAPERPPERTEDGQFTQASNDLADWWKRTRDAKLARDLVLARAKEEYGCEPVDMTADDREELYANLVSLVT